MEKNEKYQILDIHPTKLIINAIKHFAITLIKAIQSNHDTRRNILQMYKHKIQVYILIENQSFQKLEIFCKNLLLSANNPDEIVVLCDEELKKLEAGFYEQEAFILFQSPQRYSCR